MEPKVKDSFHMVSLVVRHTRDIPKVRSKAKLLAEKIGFCRLDVIRIALSASEMARFILLYTKGGIIKISLITMEQPELGTGIELYVEGEAPLGLQHEAVKRTLSRIKEPEKIHPIPGLKKVMDFVMIRILREEAAIHVRALKWGLEVSIDDIQKIDASIRSELFADTEESYIENLRAKHEEVVRLLREKIEKNRELDRANSELLQLSKDLEALAHERTLAELALRVADQIRNPAITIGGLTKLLAKELPEGVPGKKKLEAIFKEACKLEKIVKNFEQLAKSQTRFFTQKDLRSVVQEAVKTWRQSTSRRGIKTQLFIESSPIPVKINPRTFKVAFLHILRNAEEASPPEGTIKIQVGIGDHGRPFVAVSDQGPGIPEEIMDRLFKTTVTTKSKGAGVGLMMVKQVMEEHQGEVKIDTKSGKGTTVNLIFPDRWKEFP